MMITLLAKAGCSNWQSSTRYCGPKGRLCNDLYTYMASDTSDAPDTSESKQCCYCTMHGKMSLCITNNSTSVRSNAVMLTSAPRQGPNPHQKWQKIRPASERATSVVKRNNKHANYFIFIHL